jgi:hypothetical protein
MGEPVAATFERLQRFAPLGVKLPQVEDWQSLNSLTINEEDLIALSRLDGDSPWIEEQISAVHIIGIAEKLGEPVAATFERLQRFAPLGVKLPQVEDWQSLNSLTITEEDLIALSRRLDGKNPWIEEQISAVHIIGIAEKLGEPVAATFERLQRFAPLGVKLPQVEDWQSLNSLTITEEDLIALSRRLDGKNPWIEEQISAVHILLAAAQLNEPVATTFKRLNQFVPLGLKLPQVVNLEFLDPLKLP